MSFAIVKRLRVIFLYVTQDIHKYSYRTVIAITTIIVIITYITSFAQTISKSLVRRTQRQFALSPFSITGPQELDRRGLTVSYQHV